jgi:FtsH-binding integral membrane protein
MSAMAPLFIVIFGLEGFEKAAFWLFMFIAFLGGGFFVDYLMQKQGFGVFWNAVYVFAAGFAGLYLRYNYFQRPPYSSYEPFVTAGLFFITIAIFLTTMSFLRNRFW